MTKFTVKSSELAQHGFARMDAPYWMPEYREQERRLEECGLPLSRMSCFIESIESGEGVYELSDSDGWKYLNVNNITPNGIDDSNCGYLPSLTKETAANVIRQGDIVTGRVGTIGVFVKYECEEPSYISDNVFRLRLKDCNPDYILAVLNTRIVRNQIDREAKGSLQRVVNKQTIRNLLIPVPPPEVQRRMVAELDAACVAKRKADEKAAELLASVDDIVLGTLGIPSIPPADTSLASRIFTVSAREVVNTRLDAFYHRDYFRTIARMISMDGRAMHLGKIGKLVRGVTYSAADEENDGFAVLRANNVSLETGEIDLADLVHVRRELCFDDAQRICSGDILICAASGSKEHAGKVAYVEDDLGDAFAGGFMTILRVEESVAMPRYVAVYMQSQIFRRLILRHLGGTNINNVSLGMLNALPIIVPPKDEQEEIVAKVISIRDKAKRLKADAVQSLAAVKMRIEDRIIGS